MNVEKREGEFSDSTQVALSGENGTEVIFSVDMWDKADVMLIRFGDLMASDDGNFVRWWDGASFTLDFEGLKTMSKTLDRCVAALEKYRAEKQSETPPLTRKVSVAKEFVKDRHVCDLCGGFMFFITGEWHCVKCGHILEDAD